MRILSLCTSAGLWDRAWIERGHWIVPGCEIMEHKRAMYYEFASAIPHLCKDIADLADCVRGEKFDGVIGGIPCQSRSSLRALRPPKFGDLLDSAIAVLNACDWDWFLLENVAPLEVPGSVVSPMNAMNYGKPHQSRPRYFTHSNNLTKPEEPFPGSADDLFAYSVVAGRIYGPKRAAKLQGWPEFSGLPFSCAQLQEALADGVPRCLADAWINHIEAKVCA